MKTIGPILLHRSTRQSLAAFLATFAVISVSVCVVFEPVLRPSTTFGGMDFLNLIYPQTHLAQNIFRQGELPLWNWYNWGGAPLLAAWQAAVWYPPTWVAMWMGLPYGLQVSIIFHLILAGVGAAQLSKRLFDICFWGSALAGIAYCCSGFFLGHIEQVNSIAAIAWTPWLIDGFLQFLSESRGKLKIVASVCGGLLAGHPQHIILVILALEGVATLLICCSYLRRDATAILLLERVMLANLWITLAIALASLQIFPSLELSSLSERIWPYPDPFVPHFRWSHFGAFVVPRFFNRLAKTEGQPVGFTEEGVYTGLITVLLCFLFVAKIFKRRRLTTSSLVWGAIFIGALTFALGPETPFGQWLFSFFPKLGKLRGTARALNLVVLCLSCGAAAGLSVLLTAVRGVPAHGLGLLAVGVLAVDLAWTHRRELESLLIPKDILGMTRPVASAHPTPRSPNRVYRFMAHDSDLYLDHRASAVSERMLRLQPNVNILYEVATLDGYEEGLLPSWSYGNFMRQYNRNLRNSSIDAPLLALLGVETVLTEYPVNFDPAYWCQRYQSPHRSLPRTAYSVWQNQCPTAWFFCASTLWGLSRDADTNEMARESAAYAPPSGFGRSPKRVPTGTTTVNHPLIKVTSDTLASAIRRSHVVVESVRPNSLLLRRTRGEKQWLVFTGSLCPGWKLLRNGIVICDVGAGQLLSPFSLINIPPLEKASTSQSVVQMVYWPFSLRLGLFLSLALTLLLGTFFWNPPRRCGEGVDVPVKEGVEEAYG